MNRTKRLFSALAVCAGIAASPVANAGALWEFTSAGNTFTNGSWDFATSFTVGNVDLTATGLGYYADPETGAANNNAVALYRCDNLLCSTTGTLLATATVDNTYPLFGHFRYVTIPDVTLQAGLSYQVAGVSVSNNYTWNDPGFANDPGITLIVTTGQVGRWQSGNSPDFLNFGQTDIPGQDGFHGPNVFIGQPTFTNNVPEPASLGLLAFGLAGLGAFRRRK